MPLETCGDEGKPGFRWGDQGLCYTYDPSDPDSANEAKRKAFAQGYMTGDLNKEEAEVAGVDVELQKTVSKEYMEAVIEKVRTLYPHVWSAIHQYALPRSGGRALANRRREKDQPGAGDVHVPSTGWGHSPESVGSYRRRRGLKADEIELEDLPDHDADVVKDEDLDKVGTGQNNNPSGANQHSGGGGGHGGSHAHGHRHGGTQHAHGHRHAAGGGHAHHRTHKAEQEAEELEHQVAREDYLLLVAKAGAHPGSMIAAYPPHDLAMKMALPGGEPAGRLHMTLVQLPDSKSLTEEGMDRAIQAVKAYAASATPMMASISGLGRFHGMTKQAGHDAHVPGTAITPTSSADGLGYTQGDDESMPKHVVYASIDHPDLGGFHHGLVEALKEAGVDMANNHGFTPHMTLAYINPHVPMPEHPAGSRRFEFPIDSITMSAGGEAHTFPLGGRIGHETKKDEWHEEIDVLFAKAGQDGTPAQATAKQIVYGVVLQPGVKDSQGDVISADDIEKAAHRYLVESRLVGVQHERQAQAEVVESFIAPTDMEFQNADGEVCKVLKGAWVMAVHVSDPTLWKAVVKREITGFSIGGTGVRQSLKPAA